ncbi:MAG TPA: phosphate ABC transporter substrate-binding/OmpA family protein [Pirellulaceae bacterium]|nr:phosphate ABC transporter substrate-binding/OmpA family protein [Pirellulaceae bacterium]HMO92287.1 phosphate ABC transporter substrate-binding/OmpA family protein [Pirellulaceae bacterium]HMP71004.1 phosphate ABC transporter substrate-binding/OmpA family protein [Pirellulaceae bacterium]
MAGKPTPAFYALVALVVIALLSFAVYRIAQRVGGDNANNVVKKQGEDIDPGKLGGVGSEGVESPDSAGITTVQEYEFIPSQKLPPVQGVAAYQPLEDNTIKFALNVWAGWAPIIYANDGFAANKVWKTADGKEFKVELVLIDDPVQMRDAYAAGNVHIGWATLDMVPLFMESFVDRSGKPRDSRIMPRIYQQVDWSNGGDGIVVRENIKTVADLRGKKIVLAENSPSQYFLLNMLVAGGVQPSEVDFVFTQDAFAAAAAFNAQRDISACVSWAPDIYNLSEVRGNRMLVTSATANKLIADVWFARADFANDHSDLVEGLVRGIFDAMVELKTDNGKQKVAQLMATGYSLPANEALAMLGDAHSTNWAENYQFFVNRNNPTNFERVWNQAYYLYRRIGKISHQPVPFDQVMDFSLITKLGQEEKYSVQVDEYRVQFVPKTTSEVREAEEILTNTVVIHFMPNSHNLYEKVVENVSGQKVERMYDPNVELVLEEIAKLAGQFGRASIIIEGHTDASMKGRVNESAVKELSMDRANAVKQALVEKFPTLDANQFNADGLGWDRPADPGDPRNHAKNRRVEIKIYPTEAE